MIGCSTEQPGPLGPNSRAASLERPRRWTPLVLLLAVTLALGLGFAHVWRWGLFGMFDFKPPFADTVAILAAGQTWHEGGNVYTDVAADPLHRPHVYGPLWLATGALGLRVSDAVWIGTVLVMLFVLTVVFACRPRSALETALVWFMVCSPPVLLGVSRGNNDVVIYIMLSAAAWLLSRKPEVLAIAGRILLGVAAVLKMYPFAALPVLLLRLGGAGASVSPRHPHRAPWLWFGATTAVCLAVLWYWADDYRQAIHLAPNPVTLMSYGVSLTLLTWQGLGPVRLEFAIGATAGILLVAGILGPRARHLWTSVRDADFAGLSFLFGALMWIFSFFAIRSFPYRLLLLLLPVPLWLERNRRRDDGGVGRLQLLLWIVAAWTDVPKRFLSRLAELGHESSSLWQSVAAVAGFEQALITGLTFCLLVGAIGCFVRTWFCAPPIALLNDR